MKINEIAKATGLSQKAIRLYENKGLICVSRTESGYRNYSEEDVTILKTVKLLRSAGVSISDIKLYFFGVLNIEDIMNRRKTEIEKESGINSEKYRICEEICANRNLENEAFNYFSSDKKPRERGKFAVGIDLGTTTISVIVYDLNRKRQIESYTIPHDSRVRSDIFSEQSIEKIVRKAEKLLYHIIDYYEGIVGIGLSGQMHGIVYINAAGEAVSELINWQDKRADQRIFAGKSACERIALITGERIYTGYGLATHYYNLSVGLVPENVVKLCGAADYFGMKICGLKAPVIHISTAASFGLFDLKKNEFKKDKLLLLGISEEILPDVTKENFIIGKCRGIPVSVALGDNQTSFLGAVKENSDSLLINIGTGSQVSAVSDYREVSGETQIRPFIGDKYLICGAALCGGYAYAMLEKFFRSYVVSSGMPEVSQYNTLNALAEKAYESGEIGLNVNVSFFGQRGAPDTKGAIKEIDGQNFTPGALALGVLKGMCEELYELYEGFREKKTKITASGGAVKKNKLLRKLLEEHFGMPVGLNAVDEDAAMGAALFSALAAGIIGYDNGFSEYIKYEEENDNDK